jgi:hypothetical protein
LLAILSAAFFSSKTKRRRFPNVALPTYLLLSFQKFPTSTQGRTPGVPPRHFFRRAAPFEEPCGKTKKALRGANLGTLFNVICLPRCDLKPTLPNAVQDVSRDREKNQADRSTKPVAPPPRRAVIEIRSNRRDPVTGLFRVGGANPFPGLRLRLKSSEEKELFDDSFGEFPRRRVRLFRQVGPARVEVFGQQRFKTLRFSQDLPRFAHRSASAFNNASIFKLFKNAKNAELARSTLYAFVGRRPYSAQGIKPPAIAQAILIASAPVGWSVPSSWLIAKTNDVPVFLLLTIK